MNKSEAAWREAIERLHDLDDIERAVAAYGEIDALARDAASLPRLRALLERGRDPFVREAAAAPLARLEGLKALPRLLKAMGRARRAGHDNDGLSSIVSALVRDDRAALPRLRRLLRSRSPQDRADGAWLWGFVASVARADPLLPLVRDRSSRVRAAAACSLASFPVQGSVLEAALRAAGDRSPVARKGAAVALLEAATPEASAALTRLRDQDPDESVRAYVAAWMARRP